MKILVIDKTAVLNSSHERYERIASHPEVELCVFSPTSWHEHMRQVRAERTHHPAYRIELGKTFWNGSYSRGFYLTGLKRCIRDFRPDVIQLLEEPWSLFAGQAVNYARKFTPDCRLLFYTWENIYREGTYCSKIDFIHRRVEASVFEFASSGICATKTAAEVLSRKGFSKPTPVIPYGIPSRFIAAEEEIHRRQARPLSEPPRIGYIGRLLEMKGIDTLIRALTKVEGELILLGSGEAEKDLRALSADLGLEPRITWISAVPPEEVIEHLRSLDVLVLPSRTTVTWAEQLGRVMLEAMGSGVPVIGSSSGSIPEVIGNSGLVFEEGNEKELAEKLGSLFENADLRRGLIQSGWEKVRDRYTWRSFADDLIHHYQSLLNESQA
ncbi:MAG: glycosyltransferase [Candidatus Omnitrophica bacterium]|nr:glycosyltransferase [Candidatus Omnitrophota bacterium]